MVDLDTRRSRTPSAKLSLDVESRLVMSDASQQNLFSDEDFPTEWETAADLDRLAADVVFNRPLETRFSYLVPDELRDLIQPGQRVLAPFGRGDRPTIGYCVGIGPPPKTTRRLKSIHSIADRDPILSEMMLKLTRWIADRYLCAWGQVLESVVPAGVKRKAGTRIVTFFEMKIDADQSLDELKLPAKQLAVMQVLAAADRPLTAAELSDQADCGIGPIQALQKKRLIRAIRERTGQFQADFGPVTKSDDIQLNTEQAHALSLILETLNRQQHKTLLLHGVTGSGKTEVYIQAIREIVGYGRQAIVLVPEISLTPQTIRRFRSRFDRVAVLHSHLSDSERHWHWQQIASGNVQVVVGARSAVFAPTPQLGMIIIDEEHEPSFKQDSLPRYHARDVARHRAELENIPLILGSATPTLDSWLRAQRKQDTLLSMPSRVEGLPLPPVSVVDVRTDPRIRNGSAIGRALYSAIQTALRDNGQVILFLNLRGFSPTVWCRPCGQGVKCPHCDITLTWHRDRQIVLCHCCDYQTGAPQKCPICDGDGIRFFGIGTQKLEDEIRSSFRNHSVVRMDSDSMKKPGSHDEALEAFRRGDVHILLGTQMIAKGLDFPNVTLVGVIDADTILHQPDLRSAERTFQLLAQVAGRTGRSRRGGRVLVQTSTPEEPAIQQAARHDYIAFARRELESRHAMQYPPFTTLVRAIVRGPDELMVRDFTKLMADKLRQAAGGQSLRILGPAPAPIARLRRNFRFHLQITSPDLSTIRDVWRSVEPELPDLKDIEYAIDVDPINMR